jgi:hypothetical protein
MADRPTMTPELFMSAAPKLPNGNTAWASAYAHELHEIINRQAHRQPRNMQSHLGPSEIGDECLSGEIEVVTRQGFRKIRDLAKEGEAELLIPVLRKDGGIRHKWGQFRRVPVECFGEQELYEITLRRDQDVKVVRATAAHHWYRSYWPHSGDKKQERITTADLRPGHKLTQLRAARPRYTTMMPVAIAQGFAFGDGTKGYSNGNGGRYYDPVTLDLFHNGKDEALLPFYPGEHKTYHPAKQKHAFTRVRGLPRFWKRLPPLDESVSFLMSWLAGYFAADGCLYENGRCQLSSAREENLKFVQNVAAICGIGYGQVRRYMRASFSSGKTPMYHLSLRRAHLPDWFFLTEEHARRARALASARELDKHWVVESVRAAGQTELVYCAITGDASAFALADDLMTGNCDRKVVGKLAGEAVTNHVVDPWASIVGTAVHAWLAEKFGLENRLNQFAFPRWLTEQRVSPHPSYPGTADLYDTAYRACVDWKVLGPTSMAKVRRPEGPPQRYQIQLLLYALGYRNLGLPVDRVVLAALPRTEPTLDAMFVWEHQYSALDDVVIEAVLGKTATRRQIAGEVMARNIPIEAVPITPSDDGCFFLLFCPFYRPQSARDGGPGCPGHSSRSVPSVRY